MYIKEEEKKRVKKIYVCVYIFKFYFCCRFVFSQTDRQKKNCKKPSSFYSSFIYHFFYFFFVHQTKDFIFFMILFVIYDNTQYINIDMII